METEIRSEHEPATDVMHFDLCDAVEGSIIDVIDVGEEIGFPKGQVLVRMERESERFLGLTIQGFSSFRKRLVWKYRMLSVERAIHLLIHSLRAGMQKGSWSHASA